MTENTERLLKYCFVITIVLGGVLLADLEIQRSARVSVLDSYFNQHGWIKATSAQIQLLDKK